MQTPIQIDALSVDPGNFAMNSVKLCKEKDKNILNDFKLIDFNFTFSTLMKASDDARNVSSSSTVTQASIGCSVALLFFSSESSTRSNFLADDSSFFGTVSSVDDVWSVGVSLTPFASSLAIKRNEIKLYYQ